MGSVTGTAEVRHFRAQSWAWLRRPRAPLRLVVPPPTWPGVFAALGHLWQPSVPVEGRGADRDDQDAWRLLWTGAKHFGAPVDHHGDVTPEMMRGAAEVLRGGEKVRDMREALRSVVATLDGARMRGGASSAGFDEVAIVLCQRFGRESEDAPVLASMLAKAYKPAKSGRPPAGQVSESRIASWLVKGGPWADKLAATIARTMK